MMCQPCKDQAAAGVIPHEDCKEHKTCTCQHGRPLEMSATGHGFAGYVDSLPEGHPAREELKRRTGHDIHVPDRQTRGSLNGYMKDHQLKLADEQ